MEGKIYHKFDMKPHNENLESYGKLCRERTNKYMTKTRQIQVPLSRVFIFELDIVIWPVFFLNFVESLVQVIDNDNGLHMRPMPGMIAVKATGSIVLTTALTFEFLMLISIFLRLFAFFPIHFLVSCFMLP